MTRAVIPTFYDMGAAGFWRDMLANSPWLRVSDFDGARRDCPDASSAADPFPHGSGDSCG